jgi:hypothetical protein
VPPPEASCSHYGKGAREHVTGSFLMVLHQQFTKSGVWLRI